MWDFVCELIGKKYFAKTPQDFSEIEPKLHEPINRLLDIKGWLGIFFLADFLADYEIDPNILDRCKRLANNKRIHDLKVKK